MLDTAIRLVVVYQPLQPPPKPPVIKTGKLGAISVGDLVLGAESPGLPASALRKGRRPP